MRNTPDDRRQHWSLLPPGVVLELSAVRVRSSSERDRRNPTVAGYRHPVADQLLALLARAGHNTQSSPRMMLRGGPPGTGGSNWSLRCRVHPRQKCDSRPPNRRDALTVHCRLTAAILDEADVTTSGRPLAAALHAFRLHVQARPIDADTRRHLRLYLLLRLLAHGADETAVLAAIQDVLRQERRRMRRRLRDALRRLHRKMSVAGVLQNR